MSTTFSERSIGVLACDISESIFRVNPDFEFVGFDRLTAEEDELIGNLRRDPSFCGIVRPRSAGLTAKAVCGQTANLLDLLREPGPLPASVLSHPESELFVSRLVCDGILQVTQRSEWVFGPAACRVRDCTQQENSGRLLSKLSLKAIRHVAALETACLRELGSHLYRYNTLPLTPQWLRRIPSRNALEEYLQIQVGGSCRRDLDRNWTRSMPVGDEDPWLGWNSQVSRALPKNCAGYKLYLSPLPALLRDAFWIWVRAITKAGAYHFKIGSNVRGMLRPDKMVAYFGDLSAVEEAAYLSAQELSGCPAQGVPFTAELDCGALLSWGSDPPVDDMAPVWLQRQSWRQWVCNRLGSALAVARHEKTVGAAASSFALDRLSLEGVDVTNWTPGSAPSSLKLAEVQSL